MPTSAKPIDPRLLRHASAARGYLILTVVLGVAGTGLILAQAGLLARLLAGAATGVGLAVPPPTHLPVPLHAPFTG
ncbi:MAG: hypothetical protein ACRDRJ_44625, partial [Streptosporangiaceae bacterium]